MDKPSVDGPSGTPASTEHEDVRLGCEDFVGRRSKCAPSLLSPGVHADHQFMAPSRVS